MASKEKEKKQKNKSAPPKKSKKKLIFILLLLIILLMAGGGAGFFFLKGSDKFRPLNSQYFEISGKTEKFIYEKSKDIHNELSIINNELIVVNNEIERVLSIEKEYPMQKKITDRTVGRYEKLSKATIKEIKKLILRFDAVYVEYAVNPETGSRIMEQESKPIKTTLDQLKQKLAIETEIIKKNTPGKKSFFKKISDKFF